MKTLIFLSTIVMTTMSYVSSVSAALIDFEGLANGTTVTNQFAEVAFSSNADFVNLITTQPGIGAGSNFLCTGSGDEINCTQETILSFTSPVSGLTFLQVGDNASGVVASVDVFENNLFSSTVNINGTNDFFIP